MLSLSTRLPRKHLAVDLRPLTEEEKSEKHKYDKRIFKKSNVVCQVWWVWKSLAVDLQPLTRQSRSTILFHSPPRHDDAPLLLSVVYILTPVIPPAPASAREQKNPG